MKRFSLKRLLTAAAIWHLAIVFTIFLVGRLQLLPGTFDEQGTGVSFAIDSREYRAEAETLATLIREGRVREWAGTRSSFHVKLYSISFALTSWLFGANILAAEPLNLSYYLLILASAFLIAREMFDHQLAVAATGVIALWPSLLLHTTQLLRDALFIPALLLFVLALVMSLRRRLSVKQALLVGGLGLIGALLVWLCRGDGWEVVVITALLGAIASAVTQIKRRQFALGATIAIAALVLLTGVLPKIVPAYRRSNELLASRATIPVPRSTSTLTRIGLLRQKFIARYPGAGSNIDADTQLQTTADVVRYLPRAVLIGFCAPFPTMWFTPGVQVGLMGRLLAGVETLVFYAFLILCGVTLWKFRTRADVWFIFAAAAVGCVALGYVVVNASSLYRMRYAYSIMVIILGIKGLLSLFRPDSQPGLTE